MGDPNVGFGQCRWIVDSVTYHRPYHAIRDEFLSSSEFGLAQQLRLDLSNSQSAANGICNSSVITGQADASDTQAA